MKQINGFASVLIHLLIANISDTLQNACTLRRMNQFCLFYLITYNIRENKKKYYRLYALPEC